MPSKSTGGHPVFSNDVNDQFRAVHDVFGHLGAGRSVDRHGEEAAYQEHGKMFSPLARAAMATETRGQNSALHVMGGEFPPQKVGILPRKYRGTGGNLPHGRSEDPRATARQARDFNRSHGVT